MKTLFILFAILGITAAKAVPVHRVNTHTRDLQDDLNDFLALIPIDEIVNIVLNHLANDPEVQAVVEYVLSDDFKSIVLAIDALPEYIDFLNYLQESGLDVYKYVNILHDFLGLPQLTPPSKLRRTRSIRSMVDEILAILPLDELQALFYEKLETSPDFKELYDRIRSPEFQSIVETLNSLPEYQELLQKLRDAGIDVDAFIDLIRGLFGLPSSSSNKICFHVTAKKANRNLQDDLNDFLALIPIDEIVNIVLNHLANDPEVQAVAEYVVSDDFKSIVLAIDALPEYIDFLNYLQESGLDVYKYVNILHDFLGLPQLTPPSKLRRTRSIRSMVDEILAILPLDELQALFYEKLETSPDFKELYDRIRSPEFQSIVETLNSLPEYQELLQKLRDAGIDVDAFIDLIRGLFGLPSSSSNKIRFHVTAKKANRNLQDDLNDFLALIPIDEIVNIVLNHLANDPEVQAVVEYVLSDDFKSIVLAIDALPEYIDFLNYLQESGLDVYKYVNILHDFLGLPQLTPPSKLRRTRSIRSMVDEILAILPLDELQALFYEKLETSPDFKELYDRIRSPEFQSIVETLNSLPEYQELLQKLRDAGIDVDAFIDLIRGLFGLPSSSSNKIRFHVTAKKANRNLQDDLNDFLALIPIDEIVNIVLNHLANDPEVQAVVEYVLSDDFKSIVLAIDALPEYIDFLNYLQESGLDVYKYVNILHDFLGLPQLTPPSKLRHTRSIRSMVDEILAILPLDELRALFDEKLETSPDFKELYDRIRSPEFQSIVETLNSLPEYQELLQKLRDAGIDVDAVIDLIRGLFGLPTSSSNKIRFHITAKKANRNLQDDLNDFLALIPVDEIVAIVLDHLANDPEVQAAVQYILSDDFKSIVLAIDALPEYIDFLNYLQESGLDVYKYVNALHDFLGLPQLTPPSKLRHTRSIRSMVDEILAILPLEELRALFDEKLETSPDFKELYDRIRSPEFQSIVETLNSLPEYQELLQKLRDAGIDVDAVIDLIRGLFGLPTSSSNKIRFHITAKKANRNLQDDLNDFLALIPVDEIVAIVTDHLANDPEVQAAVQYILSDDFKSIVLAIDALPEYIDFLNYLQESGLDVYKYVNALHDFLGLPQLTPPSKLRHTRSIRSMVDEILAILPLDELQALFNEKLETSPDFKELYDRIRSPEFQSIVETLNSLPEYQELLQKLRDAGIDVDAVIDLIRGLFGLPTKKF
ncbi:uncharacterized protein LOC126162248 isoform X14 [Schistocerca cancellata]|uniref:uncharacterized protein LOC126162248 isoform X9 n=1 Tax=Schistocerca cancellata TaxID=274614 RepID=UPI00211759CA|nr:uncharacterized protein LOC126162248 isoform X9 [Schistocerca cancellata]XP_049774593.1 uncharacterized protein LOC126162248 isoform X11 [Schistocerca cancellata]XP_049774594.1 uncharacterized protein LOC126162248 isoform X12 [Schistocerca cancellata]XP_049774595.1 uncharacterized protein LOC126162248 isoform X13 [Schistocerca cancellata]XP_049774596.1 uncharacterized protein LOC126162248 isoform X14 [Schistocerca cancellata]